MRGLLRCAALVLASMVYWTVTGPFIMVGFVLGHTLVPVSSLINRYLFPLIGPPTGIIGIDLPGLEVST